MSFVIRAARPEDLQPIYEMAKLTGGGFTNLPADRKSLQSKIERSTEAFARTEDSVEDELFVLVLENTRTREIRGTCQLLTRVGQKWPFYSYRLSTLTQHSAELEQTFRAEILSLVTDLEGSCEVGGLFLHPGERAGGLGLLLARSRYLFIAMHRARFTDRILAELRGVIDEAGDSPFWDSIAGRFFGMSFDEADTFNALRGNQFIADLMPKHPVYVAMLSDAARHVLGRPNVSGRAAMRMLENEGFAYENYVDIFDGGPTMTARTDQVHSIRNSRDAVLGGTADDGALALVATGRLAAFRCAYGHVADHGDTVALDAEAAGLLGVGAGDAIRWIER
ncbi:MAG: arginine N-succinyltransferase [Blastomonas fulva]|uniref:arginine N-succinyltransferase n=1 Tax=Blastomonas fulva TaxID=1550728 RepID=UPI004033E320